MHDHEHAEAGPACPPWCGRSHGTDLHPEDRHHQSAGRRAAVVSGEPLLEPDDLARPCAVVARLVRRGDSELTWVEMVSEESGEVRMVVTLESARTLRGVLDDLVVTGCS